MKIYKIEGKPCMSSLNICPEPKVKSLNIGEKVKTTFSRSQILNNFLEQWLKMCFLGENDCSFAVKPVANCASAEGFNEKVAQQPFQSMIVNCRRNPK
jgi:hypothetical protein